MKNLRLFLPIVIAVIGVLLFSQCKKDHSCNMTITCKYSSNGLDADSTTVSNAIITFDTTKYVSGQAIDTNISRVHLDSLNLYTNERLYEICEKGGYKYKTNNSGIFSYTLDYPALLIVNAVKVDAIKDTLGNIIEYVKYTGTTQVQMNEGETTEKTILMVRTN